MTEQHYAVPEEGLKVAKEAFLQPSNGVYHDSPVIVHIIAQKLPKALEAFILWQDKKLVALALSLVSSPGWWGLASSEAIETVRRMYLAPEPEAAPEVVTIYTPGGAYKCTLLKQESGAVLIHSVTRIQQFTESDPEQPKVGEFYPRIKVMPQPSVPECRQEVFSNNIGSSRAVVCSCGFATTYSVLDKSSDDRGMEFFRMMHEAHLLGKDSHA